jgi:DegP2 peptidase. Serine peptidase. MEROPS family S01B
MVAKVVPQLIAQGRYVHPALGIQIDAGLNERMVRAFGTPGVYVLKVSPGSAAAAAGLQGAQITRDGRVVPGDIITAIDGKPVDGVSRYLSRLDELKVGDNVILTIMRDERQIDLQATLQPDA